MILLLLHGISIIHIVMMDYPHKSSVVIPNYAYTKSFGNFGD